MHPKLKEILRNFINHKEFQFEEVEPILDALLKRNAITPNDNFRIKKMTTGIAQQQVVRTVVGLYDNT